MAKYRFVAIDHNGLRVRGWQEAASKNEAVKLIRDEGLWVYELQHRKNKWENWFTKDLDWLVSNKKRKEQLMLFCRQMSTLHQARVHTVTAVMTVAEQVSGSFRQTLLQVAGKMKEGAQLSEATAMFPRTFSDIFVSMVRAGEASGSLDRMLDRLALFYEKEYYTREKIATALAYPAFLAVMTLVVATGLIIFVVPQFTANFNEMGMTLPLPTRILMAVSDLFVQYSYVIPLLFALIVAMFIIMKRDERGRYILDYAKLKVPIFGGIWQKQMIARFGRTLGTLFTAAVPMVETLGIVRTVADNEVMGRLVHQSQEQLEHGRSFVEPFKGQPFIPPMFVQMLQIGERSGSLDHSMEKVANYYEAEVDATVERLKSLLEPIMLLVLASVIGMIVLAIMLPSFSMIDQM